jgi:hypothetical protein
MAHKNHGKEYRMVTRRKVVKKKKPADADKATLRQQKKDALSKLQLARLEKAQARMEHTDSETFLTEKGLVSGRPIEYDPKMDLFAKKVCDLGGTAYDVADALGVHIATVMRWKHRFPKFCEALRVGKEPADDAVEASLFRRATGYTRVVEKVALDAKTGLIAKTYVTEEVPPHTGAAAIWLFNRRGDKWTRSPDAANAPENDATPVTVNITVTDGRKRKGK